MDELIGLLEDLVAVGCVGIKVSFEDEGAQFHEMITLRDITRRLGIQLCVKIGGGEAKRDMIDCNVLGADFVVAPMIETPFALSKFIKSVDSSPYDGRTAINIETITAYNNLAGFVDQWAGRRPDAVVFGRVDFVSSFDKDRAFVNTAEMATYVSDVFSAVRSVDPSIITCLGGAVSSDSKSFIADLIGRRLLDRFETRYIIFDSQKIPLDRFNELILMATRFEVAWLRFVRNRFLHYADKDLKRIVMIEERMKRAV